MSSHCQPADALPPEPNTDDMTLVVVRILSKAKVLSAKASKTLV